MGKEISTNNTSDNNNVVVISSREIRALIKDATNVEDISLLSHYDVISIFTKSSESVLLDEKNISDANKNIKLDLEDFCREFSIRKHNNLLDKNGENYLKLLELIIEKIIDKKAGDFEKGGNDYKDLINLKRVEGSNIFIYFNWFKNIENDGLRINYLKAIMETIKCELDKTKTNGSYTYYYLLHDKDIINLNSNQHVSKAYCSFEELKKDLNFIDNKEKEREEEVKSFLNINDDNPNLFLRLFQHQKEDKAYSFLTNEIKPNDFNSPRDLQNKIIAFITREHETARVIEALYAGYRQNGRYAFENIDLNVMEL